MFLRRRFYLLLLAVALITGTGFGFAPLYTVGQLLTLALFLATIADIILLWHKRAITAERRLSTRFSNGDDNPVTIIVESTYPFSVRAEVIDELPFQFQCRDYTPQIIAPSALPAAVSTLSVVCSYSFPPASALSSDATPVPDLATSASTLHTRNYTSMN